MKSCARDVAVLLSDTDLRAEIDRVAAAAGLRAVHVSTPAALGRAAWSAAPAIVLDEGAALRSGEAGLPRRSAVFVVTRGDPPDRLYQLALSVGAQAVLQLPAGSGELMAALSGSAEADRPGPAGGEVIAVVGGRGGAGASVFAAALARHASTAILIDLDSRSGGVDLLLGTEGSSGLRWPDLAVKSGRISWQALTQALPSTAGLTVLSAARHAFDLDGGAVEAVLDASRRGGALAVCDLSRETNAATHMALEDADLVAVLCPADIRSAAATAAYVSQVLSANPNVGVVVRGPAPGGLRAVEVAQIVGLPLLASMRPEPLLAERIERDGMRLRKRSPLAMAAAEVLTVLGERRRGPVAA